MKKLWIILVCLLLISCQSDLENTNKDAITYMNQGNYTEALNLLKDALVGHEDDDTTWNNISVCYNAIGQYEEALSAAQSAVNIGKEKAAEYANLGNAYFNLDEKESAKIAYLKALDLDENYFHAKFGLGVYLTEKKQYDEALVYFDDLYNHNPLNVDVVRYIAYCQYKLGKVDAAIAFLESQLDKVYAPELEILIEEMKNNQ